MDLQGFDTAAGIANCGGSENLYRRMLGKFREQQAGFSDEFRQALSSGDQETATRLAHTLKGLAATLGATDLQHQAMELEQACHQGLGDDVQGPFETTSAALETAIASLATLE